MCCDRIHGRQRGDLSDMWSGWTLNIQLAKIVCYSYVSIRAIDEDVHIIINDKLHFRYINTSHRYL